VLTLDAARWLLVLHTALAVAAVGAATHLVLWLRPYRRGAFGRHAAVRRFGWLSLALAGGAFLVGNVLYPTYKVQVRVAYLENPTAVATAAQAQADEVAHVTADPAAPTAARAVVDTADVAHRAGKIARWFDVKEHWILLGLLASFALTLILAVWQPSRDGRALVPVVYGLALMSAGTLWLGAIIGVLVAAWRAV
jgi:hypothetical protein